jgi:hypothetical protein
VWTSPAGCAKAVERSPHKSMDINSKGMKELMNSTLGERFEQLGGVDRKEEKKKTGKNIRVPPAKLPVLTRRRNPRTMWRMRSRPWRTGTRRR